MNTPGCETKKATAKVAFSCLDLVGGAGFEPATLAV